MNSDHFDTNFSDLSDGDFVLKLRRFANKLDSHPAFKEIVPAWVPSGGRIRACADMLDEAVAKAEHDKQTEQEIPKIRRQGAKAMTYSTQFMVMYADHHNDPSALEGLGIPLRHRTYSKAPAAVPGAPEKFSVRTGPESGSILVQLGRIPGKGSIELQVRDSGQKDEASWRRLMMSYDCRFVHYGLDPVKKYDFRARYDSPAGPGAWSEVITLVVI